LVADSRRNAAWDIGYYVDALGTVRPVATFNVSSQTNGTVIAVHMPKVRRCIAAILV